MKSRFEDQKVVLHDCVERLDRLEIPYMLTGSMAMVVYAMMRMTNDVDIVIEVSSSDTSRVIDAFEPDYYVPQGSVRDAIDRQGMFNVLHNEAIVKVDCIVRKNEDYQKHAFGRRQKHIFAGTELWVISKENLILSKLQWFKENGSEMQMRDVASLIRNGYDAEYVKGWIDTLGLVGTFIEAQKYLEQNYVDGHDQRN